MSDTATGYLETFRCQLETEDDHDHEGDCQWGFACSICGRDVTGGHCPDHAPKNVPGLQLMECGAEPKHRVWVPDHDGYPGYCLMCQLETANEAHRGCEHSHHRAWRRWKATRWLANHGYSMGIGAARSFAWGHGCDGCMTGWRWGRQPYLLGRPREWWSCLIRRRHIFRPVDGSSWLCDTCCPDPGEDS